MVAGIVAMSWTAVFVAHDLLGEEVATSLPRWSEYVLTAAMIVPLAWRRAAPLRVLGVVTVLALVHWGVEIPDGVGATAAMFLAVYAAGAHGRHRWRDRVRGAAVAATGLLIVYQLVTQQEYIGFDAAIFAVYSVVLNLGYFVAAWLLGDASRRRQADQVELARRAEQLATEQRDRERRAVRDERVRIARELHDVVAHHVSVMGVQAAAARRVLDADPERATVALTAIERSGRQAVGELQRVVGFLRDPAETDGNGGAPPAPQPTLGELDRLLDTSAVPVRLQRVGRPRPLPAAVELSAYRIVQEALTNVLKHAGPAPTTVVLTYGDDALSVEVVNAHGAPQAAPAGSGRGIVGMRERAALLGGTFTHGRAQSGYRIAATLPMTGAGDRSAEPARQS